MSHPQSSPQSSQLSLKSTEELSSLPPEVLSMNYSVIKSASFQSLTDMSGKNLQKAVQLAQEIEEGNREYKYKLTDLTKDQLMHRISQLAWRLNESQNQNEDTSSNSMIQGSTQSAIYLIGVEDDGTPLGLNNSELEESFHNLQIMADALGCTIKVNQFLTTEIEGNVIAEVEFKKIERQSIGGVYLQMAVIGEDFAGKSTLIGVLLSGKNDNGKGLARTHVSYEYIC